jgi:hypothetical protein
VDIFPHTLVGTCVVPVPLIILAKFALTNPWNEGVEVNVKKVMSHLPVPYTITSEPDSNIVISKTEPATPEVVGVGVIVIVGVSDGVIVIVGVNDNVGVTDGVPDGVMVGDIVGVPDGVILNVGVLVTVAVGVVVIVGVIDMVGVAEGANTDVSEGVGDIVGV